MRDIGARQDVAALIDSHKDNHAGLMNPGQIATLRGALSPSAGWVTIIDGSPGTLSWIGGVRGNGVSPLGMDRFGQTGDLPDLCRAYRLDAAAIINAAAELLL